ncbi:hypothetical protein RND81_07G188600 [Saponaria officinalis]|uniref:Uncharacterized protein n=1 Tax=Saponaria officinalis TaxID=3572 RepID=A0AAW1JQ19_SAPOF
MVSVKSKDRKSLCEESMLVFVNILKFSSLSLARTVTTTTTTTTTQHHNSRKTVEKGITKIPSLGHKGKRSQKPEQIQASKYVMLPDHDIKRGPSYRVIREEGGNVDGQFSDYIRRFHEKTEIDHQNAIVEGKAENFIKRFHEKNMSDLNNESMRRNNYVLPPSPRQVFK